MMPIPLHPSESDAARDMHALEDQVKVELPLGDVIDKISILCIKQTQISEPTRLTNVMRELQALRDAWACTPHPATEALPQWDELHTVNQALWRIEDEIRVHEAAGRFDDAFVELARSVYQLNDRRAELKREINLSLGSRLVEEKSYSAT